MTACRLILLSSASCAVLSAAPALAQPEMTYEDRTYEYAQPVPGNGGVIYRQQPVVQPVPAPVPHMPTVSRPVVQPTTAGHDDYEVEYEYADAAPAPYPHHAPPTAHHATPYPQPMAHHAGAYPAGHGAYPAPRLPQNFDREAWLADCREGYRNNRGRRDGGIGGGLLGAAIGGVIGNRVADGERLAGTLIGAGVGGLAGLAIGSAIGGSGDRRRAREACEDWLDRYMAGGYGHGYGHHRGHGYPGYGYPGYGYGHAYTMTYVPVLVTVPQRAIVREKVIEEWVEEPTYTYKKAPAKRAIRYRKAPAPKPTKRVKYIKTK